MSLDLHPYLSIYLVGCALVIALLLIKMVVFWIICWLTKENILNKNLKKIQAPDEATFAEKAFLFIGGLLLEALLSWINVIIVIWQIIKLPLNVIREALTTKPEIIRSLRFPLWNNPNMSREAVWAYLNALQVKAGGMQPNESDLIYSLDELAEYYPSFSQQDALNQLKDLNVIDSDLVSSVFNKLDAPNEET